jgi:hypothetical protein
VGAGSGGAGEADRSQACNRTDNLPLAARALPEALMRGAERQFCWISRFPMSLPLPARENDNRWTQTDSSTDYATPTPPNYRSEIGHTTRRVQKRQRPTLKNAYSCKCRMAHAISLLRHSGTGKQSQTIAADRCARKIGTPSIRNRMLSL